MEVAELFVVLKGVTGQFNKSMAEAGMAAKKADGKIAGLAGGAKTMALGVGVAAVGIGIAAVKMSSAFDRSMEQIHTLAHVPQAAIKGLSDNVLTLAGQVGFSPGSLADALYHVESSFASTGISSKKAMDILTIGAQGAKIGHADLVDVTNALDAAIVSGIPGTEDASKAMGSLLTIVGSGDMTMQNLADAFSTGILAIGKQYGATLDDMGAALATFGDNNIRGAQAGTDMRMVIMDLTKQATPGVKALEKIGIASGQLGKDMQTGGMNKAITDLHDHLNKAGITGAAVGRVLEDAFTKKSSAPMAVLLGEFDRFESKFPELKKGATGFGDAWKQTTEQLSTKFDMAKANVEAMMIGLGHALTPVVGAVFDAFNKGFAWLSTHRKVIEEVGNVVKVFLVGALAMAAKALVSMAIAVAPAVLTFVAISLAIGAVAKIFMNLYEHNAKFKAFVVGIASAVKNDLGQAITWLEANWPPIWNKIEAVVGRVVEAIGGWLTKHRAQITSTFDAVKKDIGTAVKTFEGLGSAVQRILNTVEGYYQDHQDQVKQVFDNIGKTFRSIVDIVQPAFDLVVAVVKIAVTIIEDLWKRFGQHLLQHLLTAFNSIMQILRGVFEVIKGIFDLATGILTGKWSKAWKGIEEIFGGVWNIIVGVLKLALDLISTALGSSLAVISALWGLYWHTQETIFKAVWTGILSVLKWALNLAVDWFIRWPLDILKVIGRFAADLWNWATGAMGSMFDAVKNGGVSVFNWFANLPYRIFQAVQGSISDMGSIGQNIVTGIWNGIQGMGSWLFDKISSWASAMIPSPIKKVLGIFSPSRVMADQIGKWIPAGIAQGIDAHGHLVTDSMTNLAAKVSHFGMSGGSFGLNVTGSGSLAGAGMLGGAGSAPVSVVNVQVMGTVTAANDLADMIQQKMLRSGMRRGATNTYQPYRKG